MKTFKQIANDIHQNRTTIFKRAKRIPNFKSKHLTKKNGKWYIDKIGVKILENRKNVHPKKYQSRISTKYDYWKQAKSLENENKWLRKQMGLLIANNTKLTNSNRQLANPNHNQKALISQESRSQPKLNDSYGPENDKQELTIIKLKKKYHEAKSQLANRPVKHESFWQWLFSRMKK